MDDQENEVVGNNVPDNIPDIVQQSPPVSQSVLQQEEDLDLPIALFTDQRGVVDLQII